MRVGGPLISIVLSIPCLMLVSVLARPQAEEDRRWVQHKQRWDAQEAEVMKNVRRPIFPAVRASMLP